MDKHAEDLMFEKEFAYTRGFLDAIELIRSNANPILMRVPEKKQVDALMASIDWIYTEALEKHSDNVATFFFDSWNLKSWMQTERIPEKTQSDEQHDEIKPQNAAPALNEEKTENTTKAEQDTSIEYEQVTIKVAKPIMEFLRKTDPDNEGPQAWIESQIPDDIRAYLRMHCNLRSAVKKQLTFFVTVLFHPLFCRCCRF